MTLREELSKLDYKGIAALLAIALVLGIAYSFFIGSVVLAFIAMTIGVFGTYFIVSSFFEEEKPLKLMPVEKMVIRILDRGYIMFPQKKGGFLTKESRSGLNIYLTTKRILAMKGAKETAFDQPLASVIEVSPEKRLMTRYLRIRYQDKMKEKDVLLFVGDVDLWLQRLAGLGVRCGTDFEEHVPQNKKKEAFIDDASTLKGNVERRGMK